MTAHARLLAGNRLHLTHGPIGLVIGADGEPEQIERAYRAAWAAFPAILPALVAELPFLRMRVASEATAPDLPPTLTLPLARGGNEVVVGHERWQSGAIKPLARVFLSESPPSPLDGEGRGGRTSHRHGRPAGPDLIPHRMYSAVWPYRDRFITPMAAVAGSVADHMLGVMLAAAPLHRAYVNNGGDIALHLTPGSTFTAGVVGDLAAPAIDARVVIHTAAGIGGIATSGWRGRSQSLGLADSVTVLAGTAADADAAATMIANAVNVDDPGVERRSAREVKCDSDLGDMLVTVGVAELSPAARRRALANGRARALEILEHKLIMAAYIQVQGETVVVGAGALGKKAA